MLIYDTKVLPMLYHNHTECDQTTGTFWSASLAIFHYVGLGLALGAGLGSSLFVRRNISAISYFQ